MNVLIIGAKGMLGQALVGVFAAGHHVLAWDREEIDITRPQELLKGQIKEAEPDLLINSAAYNDVDEAEKKSSVAYGLNGYAVGNMAAVCKTLGIAIVHFSTDYVFDGANQDGYREDDQPAPLSIYGKSKLLGETELKKNATQFYLVRLSRLFGRPALSELGKKSFVELMRERAQSSQGTEVVDEEVASPTYAYDLARRTRDLVEQNRPFGIYHCANLGACTWYGFAREIFSILGFDASLLHPVPSSRFSRPAKRPAYSVLLNTQLPPMRPWQAALKEFLTSPS